LVLRKGGGVGKARFNLSLETEQSWGKFEAVLV